jgi:hypothetical protein
MEIRAGHGETFAWSALVTALSMLATAVLLLAMP